MSSSCEPESGSSSVLVSSLRNFRFTNKSKRYQPPDQSPDNQNSADKNSVSQVPDSTTPKSCNNGASSKNDQVTSAVTNRSSSSAVTSTSVKAPTQTYSPLSYRNYEATTGSQFLIPSIITKFQQTVKRGSIKATELNLRLTNEELQKVKQLVLQNTVIAEKWKRFVPRESICIDSPGEKVIKINRVYLNDLVKFVRNVYHNNFQKANSAGNEPLAAEQPKVRTYSKGAKKLPAASAPSPVTPSTNVSIQADLNQLENKGIMDEYEVFCGKEQNLRKLLDAFPGADIMEAQDILVKCEWNLDKALVIAQQQPLRCGKKRSLSFSSTSTNESVGSQSQGPSTISKANKDAPVLAEEIVLDSSDDEAIGPKHSKSSTKDASGPPLAKKARRRISSSESDADTPPAPPVAAKPSVPAVRQHNSVQQKPTLPNSNSDKSFTVSKSVTIKPVPSTSSTTNNNESKNNESSKSVSMPNLPKGLVITQVGNSVVNKEASNSKPAEKHSIETVSLPVVNKRVESVSIPSGTQISGANNKSAQLVLIKPLNNGVKPNENSDIAQKSKSLIVPPVSKGLSFTPIGKGVSITPMPSVQKAATGNDTNRTSKPKSSKGKRKKYGPDDEDDEEYGDELFFDSDDSDFEEENLTSAHSAVLKFFQESSAEELLCVPGCSKKKVESILNLKPFENWGDLVEKLGNDKYLSTDLLNGAKKVLDMRNAINKLMTKCQQISMDMGDLVENLKANKERSSGYVSKQPDLLNDRMHLTSYQMLGLNWLLLMHNQDVNGILADEMGLGKTVQAIAFLAYLREISMAGPHLIVVPSSVLDNWKQEFKAWWPDVSMICYHGSQDYRRELRIQILNDEVDEFDVMITTYNMVTSSNEDRGFFKRLEFHYVVFDEAHMLKNMASQRYQHLMKIKAPRRLLLTGTPLQNNLVELMSLLIFAMPHMFSGKTDHIKQMFSAVSKTEGNKNTYEKDRIDHAKQIMKPFVLRRLKKDVLQDLPNKEDEIRVCPMTEDQGKKYADLVQTFTAEFENKQEKDSSSSGAGMMMQLRRAANHPLLLRRFYDDDKMLKMSKAILKEPTHCESNPNLVFEDMSVMSDFELYKLCKTYKSLHSYALTDEDILNSGKFNVLDSLLPTLIEEGHRILLFSQFTMVLDIIEEYMNIKDYKFLRLDGQVPVSERQQLIDEFNSDPSIFVFLLSTRAGGLGINLTAADTVILHDIDFNPYNDKQAEDRCHRVGQVKNVRVIRFISEGTIEEGILQRAKEKLKLERDIHEEDETEENDSASVVKLLRDALGLSTKSSTTKS